MWRKEDSHAWISRIDRIRDDRRKFKEKTRHNGQCTEKTNVDAKTYIFNIKNVTNSNLIAHTRTSSELGSYINSSRVVGANAIIVSSSIERVR